MPFPRSLLVLAFASATTALLADVKMPSVFGDHMVLQQSAKLPVWGQAAAGEKVSVSIGDRTAATTAGADGRWRVDLEPLPNSTQPLALTVSGATNTLKFSDVLVGDVWLCSGQSNMGWGLGNLHNANEVAAQANNPQLRYYDSVHRYNREPQDDCPGRWIVVTPQTVKPCSAISYFFARELQAGGHSPIGLLTIHWGGTTGQAWTSLDGLKGDPSLQHLIADYEADHSVPCPAGDFGESDAAVRMKYHPSVASLLFNGMIHPVAPFAIKGVLWYQGENNTGSPEIAREYGRLLPALMADWRKQWRQPDLPFIIQQIVRLGKGKYWPLTRDSQLQTVLHDPHAALSVGIDIGEENEAHYQDKADAGHRAGLAALETVYGAKISGLSPLYDSMKVEGGKIRISFHNASDGLMIGAPPPNSGSPVETPADHLQGFEIAAADGKYLPAQASIDGSTVLVWNDQVGAPAAVRYAWSPFPTPSANLYNKANLPASPFATMPQ